MVGSINRQNAAILICRVWRMRRLHRTSNRGKGVPLSPAPNGISVPRPEYDADHANRLVGLTSTAVVCDFNDDPKLDVLGGLLDFGNTVRCCSKVFAQGGDAFEYYLNESKEFQSFKEEKKRDHLQNDFGDTTLDDADYGDLRLPPVKGSRALIIGSLAVKIGLNLYSYVRYLTTHSTQTKVDDSDSTREANKLVRTLCHGLRDKFLVAFIFHAGVYMACLGDALVFVMNSKLVTRLNVRVMWDIVLETLDALAVPCDTGLAAEHQNGWTTLNPDAEHIFKTNVLEAYPDWREQYEQWEADTGRTPHIERFMALVREKSRLHIISELCAGGIPRTRKKIEALRNKDCSEIPELKNAPVNTDSTESGIGSLDYHLYRTLAAFQTTFGVVAAGRMQIFATEAGKLVSAPLNLPPLS
jgi:hypothetical protein